MNLYLIGFRGTGKSTLAPLLAQKLEMAWLDLDREIEKLIGCSIRDYFQSMGEEAFRVQESQVLEAAAKRDRVVVATGGGAVMREANRKLLQQGFCVWLTAALPILADRLADSPERPPLTDLPLDAEIERLCRVREPHYRALARITVDTSHASIEAVVDEIVERFQSADR